MLLKQDFDGHGSPQGGVGSAEDGSHTTPPDKGVESEVIELLALEYTAQIGRSGVASLRPICVLACREYRCIIQFRSVRRIGFGLRIGTAWEGASRLGLIFSGRVMHSVRDPFFTDPGPGPIYFQRRSAESLLLPYFRCTKRKSQRLSHFWIMGYITSSLCNAPLAPSLEQRPY